MQPLLSSVSNPIYLSTGKFDRPPPLLQRRNNREMVRRVHINDYLNHCSPDFLSRLTQPDGHIFKQRRMADVTGVAVAMDVGRPFELGRVRMSSSHVPRLQLLELLLGA